MGGGLMQLVAYGAQDIYLLVTHKSHSLKLSTEDTLTLLWKLSNKLSMELLIQGDLSNIQQLFQEMVI